MTHSDWQEYWAKGIESLKDAKVALQQGRYNSAINRAYYAVLQGMMAALVQHALLDPRHKRHGEIIGAFIREFAIRRKRLPSTLRSVPQELQHLRRIADYEPTPSTKSSAA
ncbi:MAG: HEPN domain-containing protein, partial [Terriglobia bacterium]